MSEAVSDKIGWKAEWSIHKFRDPDGKIAEFLQNGGSIEDAIKMVESTYGKEAFLGKEEWEGNTALNEGLQELIDIICGLGSPTKWDSSNARLGVGDSNAAPSASQTGLQGSNKAFKAMDAGYPSRTSQTAEWRATFGGTEANFAWEEYTVVNASDDTGKNLNRTTSSKGTKASGESWTLSLKITFQ